MQAAMDIQRARWVEQRITTFAANVGSLVPQGFDAYARILHPSGDTTWSDIARTTGRVVHAEVQWHHLVTPRGQIIPKSQWDAETQWATPRPGTLTHEQLMRLVAIGAGFTSTPRRIWFCLWDGYGDLHPPSGGWRSVLRLTGEVREMRYPNPHPNPELFEARPDRPRLQLPHRAYLVYTGALAEVADWRWQGPNLWWPDDRAWFVASEIDLVSTYVGGSAALVNALCADPELEVLQVSIDVGITSAADLLNQ